MAKPDHIRGMKPMKYVEPPGLPKGNLVDTRVEVCDRNGSVLSKTRIVESHDTFVKTVDGRDWDRRGWWFDEHSRPWPFPFIRLAYSRTQDDPAP